MVITISRQYGSGGQRVGQMGAKKLGIPYYDKEVIELAAEQSGFEKKMFEEADKNAKAKISDEIDKTADIMFYYRNRFYEYLKTLGFIGFSYGVTAYTQWKYSYLIQICDVVGIFGLNLIVLFPSAFIFSVISKSRKKSKIEYNYSIYR